MVVERSMFEFYSFFTKNCNCRTILLKITFNRFLEKKTNILIYLKIGIELYLYQSLQISDIVNTSSNY
ncbi:hypothetical protein BpHYR1_028148 [Brachionus plicatilis]|uniref:Uncharacterized protein n=1 Tax=Brachionus plicatilis TaxID=10195 RepID=A0A3M7PP44_BRAPC|nr:hypothetical protein BpHYR1_028148 [Brachionus plicatilis]